MIPKQLLRKLGLRLIVLSALALILLATVIGNVAFLGAWAASMSGPLRQSVPTKTPIGGDSGAVQATQMPTKPTVTPIPLPTPEPTIVITSGGGGSFIAIGVALGGLVIAAVVGFLFYRRR